MMTPLGNCTGSVISVSNNGSRHMEGKGIGYQINKKRKIIQEGRSTLYFKTIFCSDHMGFINTLPELTVQ